MEKLLFNLMQRARVIFGFRLALDNLALGNIICDHWNTDDLQDLQGGPGDLPGFFSFLWPSNGIIHSVTLVLITFEPAKRNILLFDSQTLY